MKITVEESIGMSSLLTEKQQALIRDMEEIVPEKFTGFTKQEASEYIERNIEMYQLLTMGSWALKNGYF